MTSNFEIKIERFSVRHSTKKRDSFGNYEYEVLDGSNVVAYYWHDYRGDEQGIRFTDGRSEELPFGSVIDFIYGGGPEPLKLSPAAIKWLVGQTALR